MLYSVYFVSASDVSKASYVYLTAYVCTLPLKSLCLVRFFFKEIYNFIQKQCIKLIKSKDIYNVTIDFRFSYRLFT